MSDVDLDCIVQGARTATNLTHLDIDCCDVSTNGGLILAMLIAKHPSLTTLSACADPYRRPMITMGCVGVVGIMRALCAPNVKLSTLRYDPKHIDFKLIDRLAVA
jgi:hypothetical protein